MKPVRDYGPLQMRHRIGLAQFQVERALKSNLIPPPDRPHGRWSATIVDEAAARVDEIVAAVDTVPDVGAGAASVHLSGRFNLAVSSDAVMELARMGLLPVVGDYKGWPLYCGRTIERFDDGDALERAGVQGALLTADQAAERMCIRRSDFDHLVRAGLLTPMTYARGAFQGRHDRPNVPLYRTGDVDALLDHTGIDWDAVWTTPKGFHSPLAKLPTAAEAADLKEGS